MNLRDLANSLRGVILTTAQELDPAQPDKVEDFFQALDQQLSDKEFASSLLSFLRKNKKLSANPSFEILNRIGNWALAYTDHVAMVKCLVDMLYQPPVSKPDMGEGPDPFSYLFHHDGEAAFGGHEGSMLFRVGNMGYHYPPRVSERLEAIAESGFTPTNRLEKALGEEETVKLYTFLDMTTDDFEISPMVYIDSEVYARPRHHIKFILDSQDFPGTAFDLVLDFFEQALEMDRVDGPPDEDYDDY